MLFFKIISLKLIFFFTLLPPRVNEVPYCCAGLELLLGILCSTNFKQQLDGAAALYKLGNKALALASVDAAPPSPTPQVFGQWPHMSC